MNHFVLKGFFDFKITKVALVGLVLASLAEMVLQSYTGCIKYEGAGVLFVKNIDDKLGWQLFFSFFLLNIIKQFFELPRDFLHCTSE